jgi:hypothetical protein
VKEVSAMTLGIVILALVAVAAAWYWRASRSNRGGVARSLVGPVASEAAGPTSFFLLLRDGGRIRGPNGELTIRIREVGKLKVLSGRIVACDPMLADEPAFERGVSPGEYPVFISIAHLPDDDYRVASAFVRFAEGAPRTWSVATRVGDVGSPGEEDRHGYGVDSAMGCFADAEVLELDDVGSEEWFEDLKAAMNEDEDADDRCEWADFVCDQGSGLNVCAFDTGLGDGYYTSYWGLSETGDPVCLLSDFGLLKR